MRMRTSSPESEPPKGSRDGALTGSHSSPITLPSVIT